MPEEYGVYDETAQSCNHPERKVLKTCVICPACDTFVMTERAERVYRELTQELISVQHFDSADAHYLVALEDAYARVQKHTNL